MIAVMVAIVFVVFAATWFLADRFGDADVDEHQATDGDAGDGWW